MSVLIYYQRPTFRPRWHSLDRRASSVRRSSALEEEVLDLIQRRRGEVLEESEPEALSDTRVDTIEHRVRARAVDPFHAAIRKQAPVHSGELNGCMPFGALQTPR